MAEDVLERLVAAMYEPRGSIDEWLERVLHVARPVLDGGRGVFAGRYAVAENQLAFGTRLSVGVRSPGALDELVRMAQHALPTAIVERYVGPTVPQVRTGSEVAGRPILTFTSLRALIRPLDAVDSLPLNVHPTPDTGILIAGLCAQHTQLRPRERRRVTRIARHLAAAARLRVHDGSPLTTSSEAARRVLDDHGLTGRVARLLVRGAAQKVIAHDAAIPIGSVPRHVEALRREIGAASTVELVRALRDAHARPAPPANALAALPTAEREVVEAALRGMTSTEIAALRETSRRTVENLLSRAFRRLGVSSRKELAAQFAN